MVVITLEKCPLALRGDLTMWLQEISTGVYVGQVSARVREKLWQRVCEESKSGRATMVYSAQNEQHLKFEVHNAVWEPVDFDGLRLMLRPSAERVESRAMGQTSVNTMRFRRSRGNKLYSKEEPKDYVVVDVETTGLNPESDSIIEIGAIKYCLGEETERFQAFVKTDAALSSDVTRLTGITSEDVAHGVDIEEALNVFLDFIDYEPLVIHNAQFDLAFLKNALELCDMDEIENTVLDTLQLARKRLPSLSSHKLEVLARYFDIDCDSFHRTIDDCAVTREVFVSLLQIEAKR